MRRLRGYWRALVLALVVAGITAMALWPETTEVDIVAVARGPLEVTIDEEGETRVRERFLVSAPVAGRLLRVELEPGDRVSRERPSWRGWCRRRRHCSMRGARPNSRRRPKRRAPALGQAEAERARTRRHSSARSRAQEAAGALPGGADRA